MFNQSPGSRANIAAVLRGCVCLYLGYLGVSLIRGASSPDTTMPVWLAWVFGIVMILAAAAFGLYTLYHWRSDRVDAALREEENGGTEQDRES